MEGGRTMPGQLEEILSAGLRSLSIPFTDETLCRFRQYYELLTERSQQMNLTAISGEADVAHLHLLDCAAVLTHYSFSGKSVLDVGSGAGFPGLVLKILCPGLDLTLLDSTQKRVQFQQEVCDTLGLKDVHCLHLRAEEAPESMRAHFDIVISRAVARLNILAELCFPFLRQNGCFIAMKGPAAEDELQESKTAIRLLGGEEAKIIPYRVPGLDASRTLVLSEKLRPTPARYPRRFAQIKKQPL